MANPAMARPRRVGFPLATLFAFLLVVLAVGYMIWDETPTGRVEGVVVLTDYAGRPLADADVYLNPDSESGRDGRRSRRAKTDHDGRFVLSRVTAGAYTLSASSRYHSCENVPVVVEEAQAASLTLRLTRSEPDINVAEHQSTFTTTEKPFLPVKGYVVGEKMALTPPPTSRVPGSPGAAGEGSANLAPPAPNNGGAQSREVKVRIWRTRLSEVLRRGDAAEALDKLRYTYDGPTAAFPKALLAPDPAVAEKPQLVAETTIPIEGADREGFYVARVPLTAAVAKPGLYLVQFAHGKKSACSYVLVTDLALVTKRSQNEMLGYAVDMTRGLPVAGAELRAYKNGRLLTSKVTGADGLATLSMPVSTESDDATPVAVAVKGADEAVVSRAGYWGGEDGGGYAVHTVTDRTVYRPGDTIQFKGICRARRTGGSGEAAYDVPRGVPVAVEVRDPNGALVTRFQTTTNGAGSFWGSAELSPEGATGSYSIIADVAGEKHTADVAVASYKKPEFTVNVTPGKSGYVRGEPVEMTVQGSYYFGAPLAGAKVHYYVYRDADWRASYGVSADEWDDEGGGEGNGRDYFGSGGAYSSYYGESVADGEGVLDASGRLVVRVRTDIRHPEQTDEDESDDAKKKDDPDSLPQAETYTLTATVEDASARQVEAEGAASVTAGDVLVSVQPDGYVGAPGKETEVYVTVRDRDGKPVANMPVNLAASFERWDKVKKESVTVPVGAPQAGTTGADGRAYLKVTPTQAGELRLVATTQDAGRRTVRAETGLWVTGDSGDDLDTDYGDLSLLTNKREYAPGDTARVLVNSSRTGQTVLLTVEGDRVYRTVTIPVSKHSTAVDLPVLEGWGPNVTLAACYVRNKHFASSQTPLRVSMKARELAVTVKPVGGDKYGPGDTVTYAVETHDAATGKPAAAEFSLSVVDESIYALAADDPKALRRAFYPRRDSRVNTAYSFSVEYLGDVSKAEPKIEARRKFRDTAYWRPALRTGADGRTTVAVTLPDNLTTWRATVQAVSDTTAVGYGISKVISSKPFFVRLEKPRFLTGGDASRLMALVHNETGAPQTVLVRLQATTLALEGKEQQTLQVPVGGIGKAEWTVRAENTAVSGDAPLRLTAWTPKAEGQKQYTDGVEQSLAVRAYGRTDFVTFAGVMSGEALPAPNNGGAGDATGSLMVAPGQAVLRLDPAAVAAETRLSLRVTPSVRGALVGGIEYLVGFPYGCTEQTLSRFYPDLLVQKAGLTSGLKAAGELPRMVRDGVARLSRLQHGSTGGWGWWENDKDDPFLTAYALVGLSEAKAQGYAVEPSMISKGIEGGVALLKVCKPEEKPFLLYALSVAGYDDSKTKLLRGPFQYSKLRTKLDPAKLPTDGLAYLVLLARRVGANPGEFRQALDRRAVYEGRMVHWKSGYKEGSWWDGTSERMTTALALRVLLAESPRDERITGALRWLMQSRTDGYWGDTRDTSWVLATLADYLKAHPEDITAESGQVAVRVNGRTVKTVDLATNEPELILTLPTDGLRPGPNTVEVVRAGSGAGGTVFYSGALRQTIAAPKDAELPAQNGQGITVKREVLRVLPQKSGDLWRLATEPVADGRFKQGDQLRVRLTIDVDQDASYVLIEDAFPSGAEVTERGTAEQDFSGDESWSFWYDHVDVRDDRIAFFARRLPKGHHVIEYNLRAQTPGVCRALPAHVEAMYDPSVRAESAGTKVEVE